MATAELKVGDVVQLHYGDDDSAWLYIGVVTYIDPKNDYAEAVTMSIYRNQLYSINIKQAFNPDEPKRCFKLAALPPANYLGELASEKEMRDLAEEADAAHPVENRDPSDLAENK